MKIQTRKARLIERKRKEMFIMSIAEQCNTWTGGNAFDNLKCAAVSMGALGSYNQIYQTQHTTE